MCMDIHRTKQGGAGTLGKHTQNGPKWQGSAAELGPDTALAAGAVVAGKLALAARPRQLLAPLNVVHLGMVMFSNNTPRTQSTQSSPTWTALQKLSVC